MNCFNTCMPGSHDVVQFRCVVTVVLFASGSDHSFPVEAVFNFSSDYDLLFYA